MLSVVQHWKEELAPDRRDIVRLRLGNGGIVIGLFCSYWLFWICTCVLPMMLCASVQQMFAGVQYLVLPTVLEYTLSAACTGFIPFLITCALLLYSMRRNEPLMVFFLLLATLMGFILKTVSGGVVGDGLWIAHPSIGTALVWCAAMAGAVSIIYRFQRQMETIVLTDSFHRGLSTRLFEYVGWSASAFHARLMNMSHALVIAAFSGLGMLLIIPLARQNSSFTTMANIYLGAFVPLLFALRVGFAIEVDAKAAVADVVGLRQKPYWRIVFHRWLILLMPVVTTVVCLGMLLWLFTPHIGFDNIVYCVLLGVFWQTLALALTLLIPHSGAWQIALSLIVYGQLRDDVQRLIHHSPLQDLNIIAPLYAIVHSVTFLDYLRLCGYEAIVIALCWFLLQQALARHFS
jgi:hypothetical protein